MVTVHVAGWLDSAGVEELRRACSGTPARFRLDLSELRAADPDAVDALLGLEHAGAQLIGVAPYIAMLLGARRRQGRRGPMEGRA